MINDESDGNDIVMCIFIDSSKVDFKCFSQSVAKKGIKLILELVVVQATATSKFKTLK